MTLIFFLTSEGNPIHETYEYTHIHSKVLKQSFQNNISKMNDQAHDRVEEFLFSLILKLLFIYKFLLWHLGPHISTERRGVRHLWKLLPRASLYWAQDSLSLPHMLSLLNLLLRFTNLEQAEPGLRGQSKFKSLALLERCPKNERPVLRGILYMVT